MGRDPSGGHGGRMAAGGEVLRRCDVVLTLDLAVAAAHGCIECPAGGPVLVELKGAVAALRTDADAAAERESEVCVAFHSGLIGKILIAFVNIFNIFVSFDNLSETLFQN